MLSIFVPTHDVLVPIMPYKQKPLVNAQADVSSVVRGLNFGLVFIYIHALCMGAAKALASLCTCTGLPEPWLLHIVISTCTKTIFLHRLYLTVQSILAGSEFLLLPPL